VSEELIREIEKYKKTSHTLKTEQLLMMITSIYLYYMPNNSL